MVRKWLSAFARQVRLLAVLAVVTVAGGASWSWLVGFDGPDSDMTAEARKTEAIHGWGNEFLADVHEHVLAGLPIQVANACGLGASSCFRCHNGKRAEEPGMDPDQDPWHVQHKSVNNSCAGCHQGNPRLMKQDIAHAGLIGDPRQQPATSCFSCHTGADDQGLVDIYLKLTNNQGE
ncbi:MAG: hypothetical protein OQL11_13000 [Gammaproteobacteria bacterium]|nr:hypothetical protein [Gammaproteobacteria bacterium]